MAATTVAKASQRTKGRALKFTVPFVAIHLACLLVFFVGFSWFAVGVSVVVYLMRGFGITGFYHRKFSHHAYKTNRTVQFIGAWLGTSAAQGGPLWWVAHHRRHHRFSDEPGDLHSPVVDGMRVAHYGWLERESADKTHLDEVPDLAKFPELRFLDRKPWLPIVSTAVGLFLFGIFAGRVLPFTDTNGPQMLVWAFFINTVALWHVTFAVNSVCHRWGSRPHDTTDDSRNNVFIGILGLGEGWHNNHHRFPGTSRHGFKRSQLDFTHMVLRVMNRLGLASDLHPVPERLWLGSPESRWTP